MRLERFSDTINSMVDPERHPENILPIQERIEAMLNVPFDYASIQIEALCRVIGDQHETDEVMLAKLVGGAGADFGARLMDVTRRTIAEYAVPLIGDDYGKKEAIDSIIGSNREGIITQVASKFIYSKKDQLLDIGGKIY